MPIARIKLFDAARAAAIATACAIPFACTPADRATAASVVNAAAPVLCALAAALDGPEPVAILCDPIARAVTTLLTPAPGTLRIHEKGAPSTCTWERLNRENGDPRELVCRERRAEVLLAIELSR